MQLWLGVALGLAAGILAFVARMLRRRPVDLDKLGAVSDDWIANQRGTPLH